MQTTKRFSYLILGLLLTFIIPIYGNAKTVATPKGIQRSSSCATTPKALRGTWYGGHKMVIGRDRLVFNNKVYDNHQPHPDRLFVKHHIQPGGKTYTFNHGDRNTQLPMMWVSQMNIEGHNQKVLKYYVGKGLFKVMTSMPTKHDYSYHYFMSNYMSKFGQ